MQQARTSAILDNGTELKISKEQTKSKFDNNSLFLSSFIIYIVSSSPKGTFCKLSGISFSAIWYIYIFFFTSSGNFKRALIGVWIGGIPASCNIQSYLLKSISDNYCLLYLLKIPYYSNSNNLSGS